MEVGRWYVGNMVSGYGLGVARVNGEMSVGGVAGLSGLAPCRRFSPPGHPL